MLTMDRVFERADKLNHKWLEFNQRLKELTAPEWVYRTSDELRNEYANIITLGHNNAWRILAEANGVLLPDDERIGQGLKVRVKVKSSYRMGYFLGGEKGTIINTDNQLYTIVMDMSITIDGIEHSQFTFKPESLELI